MDVIPSAGKLFMKTSRKHLSRKVFLAVLRETCYNKMNYVDSKTMPFWHRKDRQDVKIMLLQKQNKVKLEATLRVALIVMLDIVTVVACYFFGLWFRFDFAFEKIYEDFWLDFVSAIWIWTAAHILVFWLFKLYNSIWVFVSTSEVYRAAGAYLMLGILGIAFGMYGKHMPRASFIVGSHN